jgi:hypothetical protein
MRSYSAQTPLTAPTNGAKYIRMLPLKIRHTEMESFTLNPSSQRL